MIVSQDVDLSGHLLIFLVLLSYIYQTENIIFWDTVCLQLLLIAAQIYGDQMFWPSDKIVS